MCRRCRVVAGPSDQVLTAAQMRAAEQALIDGGTSVEAMMQRAGRGAAEWVWRLSCGRSVTVLTGPGNNGGDGWVIAEAIRNRGGDVAVVMAAEPATAAAKTARVHYQGAVIGADEACGEVLVDCLFGTGLTRPLSDEHLGLLQHLAARHDKLLAVDLPSGVSSDNGALLNEGLPQSHLTIALGAWKQAHFIMPSAAQMGALKRVNIGIEPLLNDLTMPCVLPRPALGPPAASANKYSRGMVAVVAGDMPGAAVLAAKAAAASGAGYVKILSDGAAIQTSPDVVVDARPLDQALADPRIRAVLIGPGLGRDARAMARLNAVGLTNPKVSLIIDADALHLYPQWEYDSGMMRHGEAALDDRSIEFWRRQLVLTPHQGELDALDTALKLPEYHPPYARKVHQAIKLSWVSDAAIVAKGADTFIFHRDFGACLAPLASSWLSTAGSGDVLAGIIAARLAVGETCFDAACQGVWLHGEAARQCEAPFTAGDLAGAVRSAFANCL